MNLHSIGIQNFSEADLQQLFDNISVNGVSKNVNRYKGGHLFQLYRPMSDLEKQIASSLGNLSEGDF